MPATVSRLGVAVVKGLGLSHPERLAVGPAGIEGDRRFHLADARGRMVNGKRHGPLVQVEAAWDPAEDLLTLRLPGGEALAAPVVLGEPTSTRFYGRQRPGRVVEGPWAAALSDLAGEALTLVRPGWPAAGHDRGKGGAVSVVGDASVAALGDLDARRFRMTAGVAGLEPYAEDGWVGRRVRLGEAVVRVTQHVGRCLVTSQDPRTGVADRDLLAVLRDVRPDDLTAPLPLGVAGEVVEPGAVAVGDLVEVL